MFMVSSALRENYILRCLGEVSYPVFLLHEPLLGKWVSLLLSQVHVTIELAYVIFWVWLDLIASLVMVLVIQKARFHKVLWNFKW
jgi:peptidoglycan/LPS O-acetylase OafA/YrhL